LIFLSPLPTLSFPKADFIVASLSDFRSSGCCSAHLAIFSFSLMPLHLPCVETPSFRKRFFTLFSLHIGPGFAAFFRCVNSSPLSGDEDVSFFCAKGASTLGDYFLSFFGSCDRAFEGGLPPFSKASRRLSCLSCVFLFADCKSAMYLVSSKTDLCTLFGVLPVFFFLLWWSFLFFFEVLYAFFLPF